MTYDEARKLLKVHNEETYEQHKERLERQRQELLEQVRKCPKKERKDWESDLVLFDRALDLLANYIPPKKISVKKILAVVGAVLVVLVAGITWSNIEADKKRAAEIQAKIVEIKPSLETALAERKWSDAENLLSQLAELDDDSKIVIDGRKQIEEGLAEERRQQLAYYSGKVKAFLDGGDWEGAEKSVDALAELDPTNQEIDLLRKKIALRRKEHAVNILIERTKVAIAAKNWAKADKALSDLSELDLRNKMIKELKGKKEEGVTQQRLDMGKSRELVVKAAALDDGVFNGEALGFLREALRLDESNESAKSLFGKMSQYTRTVNVPGDFKTLKAALLDANPQDQIVLGEGTFRGPFVVPPGVEITGKGKEKTILECAGTAGSVIDVNAAGPEVNISKLSVQHTSYDYSSNQKRQRSRPKC